MSMPEKIRKRDVRFDLMRCFACLCVCAVHFFLNSGFYDALIDGPSMYIMLFVRNALMICVPLFIVLTGCLMRRKTLSRHYYSGIVKTLSVYVLCCLPTLAFRALYMGEHFFPISIPLTILDFSAAPYAWYVNMYIGLFLLIPFLNLIYNGLRSQKEKLALIGTCLLLSALPNVVNVYAFTVPGWWSNPPMFQGYNTLISSWWTSLYPLTYYFIGCFLMEYRPKMKLPLIVAALVASDLVFWLYCLWRNVAVAYIWGIWADYGSLFIVIPTTLVSMFFLNLDVSRLSDRFCRIVGMMADCCFGAYLLSYIPDHIFYPLLIARVPRMSYRFLFFPLIVPAVYVIALLLSFAVNSVYHVLAGLLKKE